MMRRATNFARKKLISLGTCIGKFTKGGKFHLQITALDLIAPYAKVCVSNTPKVKEPQVPKLSPQLRLFAAIPTLSIPLPG